MSLEPNLLISNDCNDADAITETPAEVETKYCKKCNAKHPLIDDFWYLDHIILLALFDLTDCEQFLKACHYTNMQPMWAADNYKKPKLSRKRLKFSDEMPISDQTYQLR